MTVATPCAAGCTYLVPSATSRAGSFTGFFGVNPSGPGTYTQSGGAHGTGTVTSADGATRITAFGTNLALIGQKTTTTSSFSETTRAPSEAGTFTLVSTTPV